MAVTPPSGGGNRRRGSPMTTSPNPPEEYAPASMAISPPSGGRGSPMNMSPVGTNPPPHLSKAEFRKWRVQQGVRGTQQEMEDAWTRYTTSQRPKSGKKPGPPMSSEEMRTFEELGRGASAALRSRVSPKRASPKRSPGRKSPTRRSPTRASPTRRNARLQYKKEKYQALVREVRATLPKREADVLIGRAKESVRHLKTGK